MSEQDFKKTYNGFTKLVLWGTIVLNVNLENLAITLLYAKKCKKGYEGQVKKIYH